MKREVRELDGRLKGLEEKMEENRGEVRRAKG